MKAIITGASSGIGKEMAKILSELNYELILVAKSRYKLDKLKKELPQTTKIMVMDISSTFNCMKLFNKLKDDDIDILINCAGIGVYGEFTETSLDKELDMIDLNIKGLHVLTKNFLQKFVEEDKGYILNVASLAGFYSGPLMASYYATKSYVINLTEAIKEELKQTNSNVSISLLCAGPTETEFNKKLEISFKTKAMNSYDVAKYAIDKMFDRKLIIIPGIKNKAIYYGTKIIPRKLITKINYKIQDKKKD